MFRQKERSRRRRIRMPQEKDSLCQENDYHSQGGERSRYSGPNLPERIGTPMIADKFLHLKHLKIFLSINYDRFSPVYDYLSLVSFLDASPLLESFILGIKHLPAMKHDSVSGNETHTSQIPEHKHGKLKKVHINGFFSTKRMVELTCHILEIATSLESLTLDTIYNVMEDGNISRCSVDKPGGGRPICKDGILEAHRALGVIKMCILERVPSTVRINVGQPCSRCHSVDVNISNI